MATVLLFWDTNKKDVTSCEKGLFVTQTISGIDLQLSNTTGILQNMQICTICILSSLHYVIASSKAFFFVCAFKICLRHQSVSPFLSSTAPSKKNPGFAAEVV